MRFNRTTPHTMEQALFILTGGVVAIAGATIFLMFREMHWRDRLHTERLAAKDLAAEARRKASAEAVADFHRELWQRSSDTRSPDDSDL